MCVARVPGPFLTLGTVHSGQMDACVCLHFY